jgi:PiT family inorganic phosphate transporter
MAFAFAVTNGFHDAANAIATLVITRVARPLPAVAFAAFFNLLGPLVVGAAVAETIGAIVDVPDRLVVPVLGAALTGAVVWNVVTLVRGIPSSSGHALVGALVGAAVVAAGLDAVNWGGFDGGHPTGVVGVLLSLALSPLLGLAAAGLLTLLVARLLRRASARVAGPIRRLQWVTSGALAFSHGSNDANKAAGIVAALLLANGSITSLAPPVWAVVGVSVMLTLGTAMGGWQIVKTIGGRITRLRPVDGLVSQAASATVILGASIVGAPVSTTQVVSSSVIGVGLGRGRHRLVHWRVVRDIGITWLTTIPAAAALGAAALPIWRWLT